MRIPDEAGRIVETIDDTLVVFRGRDLTSAVVCRLPEGAELTLSHTSEFEGRQWIQALLPDGISGYVLGPSALGHTTAGLTTSEEARLDANRGAAEFSATTIAPVFTEISLLTTILIWAVIVVDLLHKPEDWGGLIQLYILISAPLLGLLINCCSGAVAAGRGEKWGWQTALIGVALWLLTILVVYLVRGRSFW